MVDYNERRTVSTNRPRRQGMARYFVMTALTGVLAGYGLGLTSGWFMFKPSRQELNALRAKAENSAKPAPATSPSPQQQPAATTGPPDPNLSFYKTLPSGGRAILGTGMNPDKPENPAPRPTVTPAPPATAPAAALPAAPPAPKPAPKSQPAPAPAPSEHQESAPQEKPAPRPQPAVAPAPAVPPLSPEQIQRAQIKGKYVVQVASYQSKAEAEAVRERLQDAGLPAYVTESVIKDKGTMYRVRVGKHLEPAAAADLAAKVGKNAIVILE